MRTVRPFVILWVLLAGAAGASAQDRREYYKKPETVEEFWADINFEVDVGKFDLAASYVKGLLALMPSDDDLLKIEQREGLSAFLRLRTVPKWDPDPKLDKQAREDVELLIQRVSKALQTKLADPVRIRKFIKNLSATPEERAFAIQELRRSGGLAVPYLIGAIRDAAPDSDERTAILAALPRLGARVMPPFLAALDIKDPALKLIIIDLARQRGDAAVVPYLWPLIAPRADGTGEIADVRKAAADALVAFLGVPERKLPIPKVALTREAERYYDHQTTLPRSEAHTVWRLNGDEVVAEPMTTTQAEEYYGLFFARKALDLDPGYVPAQLVFLSLALEKGFERAGLAQPLGAGAASAHDLALSVSPGLMVTVLERALAAKRVAVIIAAVRTLGEQGDVQAARPTTQGVSPLVKALYYPDRRVQTAAADALLRIPGPHQPQASARVVDMLRRNLSADIQPKALVIDLNAQRLEALAQTVMKAGYAVGPNDRFRTGRDALRHLATNSDYDAIVIGALANDAETPYLLAQLRADVNAGLIPVLVSVRSERGPVPADVELRFRRLTEQLPNVTLIPVDATPDLIKDTLKARIRESFGVALSEAERKDNAAEAILWLARIARGEAPGYDIRPAEPAVLKSLRSNDLALPAIEAAGRFSGPNAQRELAAVVLDVSRDIKIRTAAAFELGRHLQQFGFSLGKEQVNGLVQLYNQFKPADDARFKSTLATVVGGLRLDPKQTGLRLQTYVPPPPATAAEKKPDDAVKPEKKDEPKEGK